MVAGLRIDRLGRSAEKQQRCPSSECSWRLLSPHACRSAAWRGWGPRGCLGWPLLVAPALPVHLAGTSLRPSPTAARHLPAAPRLWRGAPAGASGRVLHPKMPEAGLKLVVPSLSLSLCFENIFIDIHFILFNEVIQMYKSNFPLDITMIRVDTQRP